MRGTRLLAKEAVNALNNDIFEVFQADSEQCYGNWFKRIKKCSFHK